ncbi:hypothetical protein O9993_03450 [Vibrio lentus]|nr:hypothetical protein [Vibrio lentus]
MFLCLGLLKVMVSRFELIWPDGTLAWGRFSKHFLVTYLLAGGSIMTVMLLLLVSLLFCGRWPVKTWLLFELGRLVVWVAVE